jgi:hypothetical protein
MAKGIKNQDNTGMYMGHGEFDIGGKFYLVNPERVRSVCYDDAPNEEKIILDFNHPENKLEYYCLDGLQLEWNKIKRDFIYFWNTNARDIEKTIANAEEYKRITGGNDQFLEQKLEEIKTCRIYYYGCDENEKNDGKPHLYSKEEYKALKKRKKENEIKYYEEQKRIRRDMIEKRKEDGESTQEKYEDDLKWLEDKYAFLKDEKWLNNYWPDYLDRSENIIEN